MSLPAALTSGATLEDGLTASREHRLERLDPVVRRLEEKVIHSGLGLLELSDQGLRVPSRRHRSAQLWGNAVPARLPQDHELPLLGGLDEVLRPVAAALASPPSTARCWPCLRLEVLRCFHGIDEIDVGCLRVYRTSARSATPRVAPRCVYKIRGGVGIRKGALLRLRSPLVAACRV